MTSTEDHTLSFILHFLKIFEMNAVETALKQPNHLRGTFTRSNEVTKIGASTDSLVMFFHRVQYINRFVVAMVRPMIVDRHSNIEFLYKFFET